MFYRLSLLFVLAFTPHFSRGEGRSGSNPGPGHENICINEAPEKNNKLINSFDKNRDPLKKIFMASLDNNDTIFSPLCNEDLPRKQLEILERISAALKNSEENGSPRPPKIRRECIEAAMKRKPGNDGYVCDYPSPQSSAQSTPRKYGTAGGNTLQCVTNEIVDYMHFSVNSAIQCLSSDNPIDSRVIFQKINNETGFNPTIAWNGGVGLGQLTTPAVRELASDAGSGKYILEQVAESSKSSCEPFKKIAQQDLKKTPKITTNNYCSWINPGDGLARNLLYSIGYYVTMRDQYIVPALSKRSPKIATDREIVNQLTAVSYGAEGLKHSRWLMQKFRVNDKSDPKILLKNIQKNSVYLKNIKGKMREIHCLKKGLATPGPECSALKLSEEELGGDKCVTE